MTGHRSALVLLPQAEDVDPADGAFDRWLYASGWDADRMELRPPADHENFGYQVCAVQACDRVRAGRARRRSFETAVTTQRRVGAVLWRVRLLAGVAVTAALAGCSTSTQSGELPLRQVSETALTGGPVRFDYTALDAERGRLFIAHMGAGELIEVDVRAHAVVRTLPNLPDVHGVTVVPDKHRVYATIDEESGQVVFRAPTDTYPDGLAYDPIRRTVWTTNESAGTETVDRCRNRRGTCNRSAGW